MGHGWTRTQFSLVLIQSDFLIIIHVRLTQTMPESYYAQEVRATKETSEVINVLQDLRRQQWFSAPLQTQCISLRILMRGKRTLVWGRGHSPVSNQQELSKTLRTTSIMLSFRTIVSIFLIITNAMGAFPCVCICERERKGREGEREGASSQAENS